MKNIEPASHPLGRAIRARALLRLGRVEEAEPIITELHRQGYRRTALENLCREMEVLP